jgi:hypothetical protein
MIYFILLAIIFYITMQFVETVSFGSRLAGKLTNRLSLGTTLQHSIYVTSRLFLPPLLLSLSYLIESGLNIDFFLITSVILVSSAFIISLLVLVKFNFFQLLFQHMFELYDKYGNLPIAILKIFRGEKVNKRKQINIESSPKIITLSWKKIMYSAFAYFFLSTGFLISFSFAILIPEYRMTVSQLTTVFHGIGAIVLAMYIDPMICDSLDSGSKDNKWLRNIYSIFIGRLLAYLLALTIFLSLYLFVS